MNLKILPHNRTVAVVFVTIRKWSLKSVCEYGTVTGKYFGASMILLLIIYQYKLQIVHKLTSNLYWLLQ